MKKIFLLAALALTMAACSNEDNITEQPADIASPEAGIPFTATITTGGATRALSGPDGENKIQAAWATGEHVALVYEVGGTTIVTDAEVTKQTDNSATINATLDANVTNGTNVTLIYPYSMVETSGTNIGKLKADAFTGQNGALTGDGSISAKYDLRQGTGKITLATTPATLKENVTMDSQIAIWKLTTKSGGNALNVTKFDVYFGGATASASIASGNAFYMAVPAGTGSLTFKATDANGTYVYSKAGVTLNKSTYYESEVSLTKQTAKTILASDGEVELKDGYIVDGEGGGSTVLKIADGATVTLNGLTNNSITGNQKHAGIECMGDATIILADGSTNMLKGRWEMPAIFIPGGKTLTIRGNGTLVADNSGANGAGIGGGSQDNCGNIVIEGGTITANGGTVAAGIGGGNGHSCGTITILGGTITATGDSHAAGIGSGASGTCTAITISGGTVNATGGDWAAGIGSGYPDTDVTSCGNITIDGSADVTATGGEYAAGIGSGQAWTYKNSCGNITIGGSARVKALCASKVQCTGIGSGKAMSQENTCGNISIGGSAHVEASGSKNAAGIGSGNANQAENVCGDITISGSASVTATGGELAAGIGTSCGDDDDTGEIHYKSKCGAITISGGTVESTGGDNAAGIGGGGKESDVASIKISSGITRITATRSNEDIDNVPIGKVSGAITFGDVKIYDGGWWYDRPTDGKTYGGIKVSANDGDMTWTLTPAP